MRKAKNLTADESVVTTHTIKSNQIVITKIADKVILKNPSAFYDSLATLDHEHVEWLIEKLQTLLKEDK